MTGLIIIAVLLVAIAVAAPRYGADSHTSDSWTVRRERALPRGRAALRCDLAAARTVLARLSRAGTRT